MRTFKTLTRHMSKKRIWSSIDWKAVGCAQSWRCALCNHTVDEHAELDHRVPLSLGGSNEHSNAQLLCTSCHKTKSMREERDRIERCREAIRQREATSAAKAKPQMAPSLGKSLQNVIESTENFDFAAYVFPGALMRHRRLFSS